MLLTVTAYADPPATLDSSFGTGGFVFRNVTTADDEIFAITVQSDGKIVAVGYSGAIAAFTVARFNANGSPDTNFGSNGLVQTPFSLPNNVTDVPSYAYAVAIQSDGKIVVGGDVGPGKAFGLVRYTSSGLLDSSFGSGGKVITSSQDLAGIRGLVIQSDGKIAVTGTSRVGNFAVVRYTSGGSLDTTFGGGDGIVTTDFYNDNDESKSIKIQADGKIIVAGLADNPDFLVREFALARYNADGSLDTGFDSDGRVTTFTECGMDALGCGVDALGIQPDGKIVVVGSNEDIHLARYNSDGSQINSIITTDIGGSEDSANAIVVDGLGGILIAGTTFSNNDANFFVAKYQSNLTLDPTFDNGNGIEVTSAGSTGDNSQAIALQPNGAIVIAGSKGNFPDKQFALARYLGFQPTAASVTIGGRITNSSGMGISRVQVSLTDSQGNVRVAQTNSFGNYSFYDIPSGQSYVITPNSTRYSFTPASLIVNLTDDMTNGDFVAE